jgi:hypothetical protein
MEVNGGSREHRRVAWAQAQKAVEGKRTIVSCIAGAAWAIYESTRELWERALRACRSSTGRLPARTAGGPSGSSRSKSARIV